MTPERWQQINAVFDAVLELPPGERQAFLDRRCGPDVEMRREVTSLLDAHGQADTFLEAPAKEYAAPFFQNEVEEEPGDPLLGQEIDGYLIQEMIGQGGMATVYKAVDTGLDKVVALKHLDPAQVIDETFVERFYREARVLARIRSEHIVEVYTLRKTDQGLFIAMEYVDGTTLMDWVQRNQPTWQDLLPIIDQILDALEGAHQNQVIHRDIKPKNIMVTRNGRVKIVDFGVAKLEASKRLTVTGMTVGTEAYMSPEQIRGEAIDARTDLWSLGVVLYEVLTGVHPWSMSPWVVQGIIHEPHIPISQVRRDVPSELIDIIDRCLRKEASRRYPSAREMRVAFRLFQKIHTRV